MVLSEHAQWRQPCDKKNKYLLLTSACLFGKKPFRGRFCLGVGKSNMNKQ